MKCPIPHVELVEDSFPPDYGRIDCLEAECAWWRKEYPACCIYSIDRALWTIAAELGTIHARMHYHNKPER